MVRVQVFREDHSKIPPRARQERAPLMASSDSLHKVHESHIQHPKNDYKHNTRLEQSKGNAVPRGMRRSPTKMRQKFPTLAPQPVPFNVKYTTSQQQQQQQRMSSSEEYGSGTDASSSHMFEVSDELCSSPATRSLTTVSDTSQHLDVSMEGSDSDEVDIYDIFKGMDSYHNEKGMESRRNHKKKRRSIFNWSRT